MMGVNIRQSNNLQVINLQAYKELVAILRKPYQDVCLVCEGTGKASAIQTCSICKGSGHRWLKLI